MQQIFLHWQLCVLWNLYPPICLETPFCSHFNHKTNMQFTEAQRILPAQKNRPSPPPTEQQRPAEYMSNDAKSESKMLLRHIIFALHISKHLNSASSLQVLCYFSNQVATAQAVWHLLSWERLPAYQHTSCHIPTWWAALWKQKVCHHLLKGNLELHHQTGLRLYFYVEPLRKTFQNTYGITEQAQFYSYMMVKNLHLSLHNGRQEVVLFKAL